MTGTRCLVGPMRGYWWASGAPSTGLRRTSFTTAFDRSSNKLYERHLHAERRSHLYTWHDSLNRLRGYERGTLASGGGSITPGQEIDVDNTDEQRSYDLDGLGNWRRTVFTPEGAPQPTTQVRQHNYVNQLTQMGDTPVTYGHGDNDDGRAGNGNVADDGTRLYEWDALNRLTAVKRKSDSQPIAAYRYDGLGRRIRRTVTNGGLPNESALNGTTDFVYLAIQCVEERSDADAVLRQYVWGRYVDELIQQKELTGGDAGTYYLLSDLLYRSVALTDASKTIHEAYDCDAYGRTLIFSAPGGSGWFSHDDTQALTSLCRFVFTGRSHDAETSHTASQLYYYRARYYQTDIGRFVSRDPIGYSDALGMYAFVNSTPLSSTDPYGLISPLGHALRDFLNRVLGVKCPPHHAGRHPTAHGPIPVVVGAIWGMAQAYHDAQTGASLSPGLVAARAAEFLGPSVLHLAVASAAALTSGTAHAVLLAIQKLSAVGARAGLIGLSHTYLSGLVCISVSPRWHTRASSPNLPMTSNCWSTSKAWASSSRPKRFIPSPASRYWSAATAILPPSPRSTDAGLSSTMQWVLRSGALGTCCALPQRSKHPPTRSHRGQPGH